MTRRSYPLLAQVFDEIARNSRWSIRGPYNISAFVRERTGEGPSGASWSAYFNDRTRPKPPAMLLFARAFAPPARQLQRMAHVFTYDTEMPEDSPVHPFYEELEARLREADGGPVEMPRHTGRSEPKEDNEEDKPEPRPAGGGQHDGQRPAQSLAHELTDISDRLVGAKGDPPGWLSDPENRTLRHRLEHAHAAIDAALVEAQRRAKHEDEDWPEP